MVKKTSILLVAVLTMDILLFGCSGSSRSVKEKQRWYAFEYELVNSKEKNSLTFGNEYLLTSFFVDDTTLTVTMTNKSKQSLYLHYNRAMIGINNRYFPVGFSENDLYPSASLIIPTKGFIETKIAPLRALRDNQLLSLFRTTDYADQNLRREILKQSGGMVTLIVPITVNGKELEYTFVLRIKKIRSSFSQENLYRMSKKTPSTNKSLIPLLLVTGITGAFLYLNINSQEPRDR